MLIAALFSIAHFGHFLVIFQVEHLGINVFVLFYIQGITRIIAAAITQLIDQWLGIKMVTIIIQSINALASLFIVLVQVKAISMPDPEDQAAFSEYSIISCYFVLVLFYQAVFNSLIRVAQSEERLFPFGKISTVSNTSILSGVALSLTAPLISELDHPIPMSVLSGFSALSVILALFLPSKSQMD